MCCMMLWAQDQISVMSSDIFLAIWDQQNESIFVLKKEINTTLKEPKEQMKRKAL